MHNSIFKWVALVSALISANLFTIAYHERTISDRYSQSEVFVLDKKTGAMYRPKDGLRQVMWNSIEENPQEEFDFAEKHNGAPAHEGNQNGQEYDEFGVPILKNGFNESQNVKNVDVLPWEED